MFNDNDLKYFKKRLEDMLADIIAGQAAKKDENPVDNREI
jgi:hypothetical protein